MASSLILGTRGSALALAQTALVRSALEAHGHSISIEIIKTTGDCRPDLSLTTLSPSGHGFVAKSGEYLDPGLFTRELENALIEGRIDIAVHSLKDLPTVMAPELVLSAVLPRADSADVLILKPEIATSLEALPQNATVATSSLRRQYQLLLHRPDLKMIEIRGNVGTRLAKLAANPDVAGIVLARAGLERLGYGDPLKTGRLQPRDQQAVFTTQILDSKWMKPAAGQGAIGLQIRRDQQEAKAALEKLNHAATFAAVTAERRLLELLGGGCQLPLGVSTQVDEATGQLKLDAILFPEGSMNQLPFSPKFASVSCALNDPKRAAELAFAAFKE